MGLVIENLIPLFFAFFAGINASKMRVNAPGKLISWMANFCLYVLLIFMGITIGNVPGIMNKILTVGYSAFLLAVSTSLCISILLLVFNKFVDDTSGRSVNASEAQSSGFDVYAYIRDPLMLAGLVALGFFVGYKGCLPDFKYDFIVTILLYAMIFFIGIKLSMSNLDIKEIFLKKSSMVLAVFVVAGTFLGGGIASFLLDMPMKHSLALSSGFGWYTLSGVLFTKMNNPLLASTAFLCDLFREVIALLLIPTLSRIGTSNIAIGVAGATAMDVTLPIIEKHCGERYVPTAFISGAILTILVPFLIPFFYYL